MKSHFTHLLSLLLVVVLIFGMFPTAMAATIDGTGETVPSSTDPAGEGLVDTDTTSSGDDDLPAPIEGYDPNDPDNPYPYGLPVTEYIPEDELAGLNGLTTFALRSASTQGNIPDEMWDNTILRALEYTGYDVQRQKDKGQLYVYEYIASRLKTNDPQVLSDISYWESGSCPNGDETVADSSTPTGKAPNISYFESNGLVCASFATYYLCNYLPNIEGIDTSVVYNKAKEMGASGNYYYLTTVSLWKRTLDALATEAGTGVTKYTDEDTAYDNLVPGDVVIFGKSDGTLTHVAIYAGAYYMYSSGGYNNGLKHFMIHVGNSRGPEISVIEWMSTSSGSKASDPIAFYHLDFNDIQENGYIEVNKKDPNGNALAGAYFTATDNSTGTNYIIGPTDSSGYAISGELPLSTYTVVESVFPDGYQASGETTWTVALTADTPNLTVTINAVNELITGKAKIVKETTNGGSKAGWHFTVTDASGKKIGDYVTDTSGEIVLDLLPGEYKVTETDGSYKYWVNDPEPTKTITVKENETATVTFKNQWRGQAQIIKTATNGGSVAGWHFTVKDTSGNVVGNYVTDATGIITLDLEPGNYSISETDGLYEYWQNDPQPTKSVTVKAGETAKVTFTNQWVGKAKIVKHSTNGGTVAGWEFTITDDNGNTVGTYVTDATGTVVADLEPGSYTIIESNKNDPYWYCDTAPQIVKVKAGETAEVTFYNQWIGKAKIIKTLDNPEAGTVEGWTFTINRVIEAAGDMQAEYITTVTTGTDGVILYDLEPGQYLITEELEDNSLWQCVTGKSQIITVVAGETAEVSFTNALRPGEITVEKVDIYGTPLAGAKFALQWSDDGITWNPVFYSDSTAVVKGGCSNPDVVDGTLITGETGVITWGNLYPNLQYRIVELEAPEGYMLLTSPAYEGLLPIDDLTVGLRVVNSRIFTLPETGSNSLALMPIGLLLCAAVCMGALFVLKKKKEA